MVGVGQAVRDEHIYTVDVAIKAPRHDVLDGPEATLPPVKPDPRRLGYPNIVRLLDGGETPSNLVMERVEVCPLPVLRRTSDRSRLRLFAAVLDAVQQAHAHWWITAVSIRPTFWLRPKALPGCSISESPSCSPRRGSARREA
jgi:hypothetical protein